MLRHIFRTCEYSLALHFKHLQLQSSLPKQNRRTIFAQHIPKALTSNATLPTVDNVSGGTENDNEYVQQPYSADRERSIKASVLIEALRERFRLTDGDVYKIMNDETVHRMYRKRAVISTMETLCTEGVTKRSFIEYPWLLTLDPIRLSEKLRLLKSMDLRDINHFVAFLRLTVPRLRKLVAALNQESQTIPCGNRVYYISQKLQLDPSIVSKYLGKRLFVLEMPFEMFEQNLQNMLDYNVSSINILKDLWAFRYTPKSVQTRLERAKRAKKDKIMPWMVRCPETILQRSLKLTVDELQVLGKFPTVVEYLADRLQFSVAETKAIMDRHPQVHTVRVTKIKEVLGYLLDEEGFTRYEIAQVPRILCHSLKTTKERLDELKSLGCRPSTLVIVCRSKREYAKFLRQWENMRSNGYHRPAESFKSADEEKT